MTHRYRHIICCFAVMAAILLMGCHQEKNDSTSLQIPLTQLKNGDLALRCGTSVESHVIINLKGGNSPFSHIGLIVMQNGQWYVAHAVPGENEKGKPEYLKMDPIDVYYGSDRAKQGCIMRVSNDSIACRQATDYAQWAVEQRKTFDKEFDWEDTTQLYCTELVQQAYLHAGIDLAEGRQTEVGAALLKGTYVFPSDITANTRLRVIGNF